eukprot:CAMPEP_0204918974 /NCGR_PEP_ID=MMETSP1397-20131031/16561_1 /ASSEMBLY_ACC=CAM_ASM_000891 /TAXON_ID=49980 /ORGANISM="Climacostomum Climacostomum virens, Strain Stock W-24" /LENGTH=86 /DNA_ID=CAMNT_0052092511 /DNA_START=41 /DNA_END=301 /DNA_ORIENTATION=-
MARDDFHCVFYGLESVDLFISELHEEVALDFKEDLDDIEVMEAKVLFQVRSLCNLGRVCDCIVGGYDVDESPPAVVRVNPVTFFAG